MFVNNQPATVGVLRQLAPELALVHAQSETLVAFDQAQQRMLLDRFGGCETEEVARRLRSGASCAREIEELQRRGAGPAAADGPVELSGEGD